MQSMSASRGNRVMQNRVAFQFTISNCPVNPGEVLIDDPARSKIKMANFRIPHLALWQPNVLAAGAQPRPGIIAIYLIVKRRRSEQRCVAVLFALPGASGIDAPPIANNEHHRASHGPALCR